MFSVFQFQCDFHVSNVVFHIVATGVVFTRLIAADPQRGHQVQRVVGQRHLMQQNLQRGVCGQIGIALAVFHAGLPKQSVRHLSGPLFQQRRLTHEGIESRLRQPKQNLVAFSDHCVSHAENSKILNCQTQDDSRTVAMFARTWVDRSFAHVLANVATCRAISLPRRCRIGGELCGRLPLRRRSLCCPPDKSRRAWSGRTIALSQRQ